MSPTASQFVGGIPEHYDRYLVPVIFDPYAIDVATRLLRVAGTDVLEIACGTGVLTGRLRQALSPGTRLTATDLNEGMVDVARRRTPDPGIQWRG